MKPVLVFALGAACGLVLSLAVTVTAQERLAYSPPPSGRYVPVVTPNGVVVAVDTATGTAKVAWGPGGR
jgi:hypothetical protein